MAKQPYPEEFRIEAVKPIMQRDHRVTAVFARIAWRGCSSSKVRAHRRKPGMRGGEPAVAAPNHLQSQFTLAEPNQSWATNVTYIRTHDGWRYLGVVVDLFTRQGGLVHGQPH